VADITASVDPVLGLANVVVLASEHMKRLEGVARSELSPYTDGSTPRLLLVETAEFDDRLVGARYLPDHETAVLTPSLDFRGNVHRCVVAHLMNCHGDAAEVLRAGWTNATDIDLFGGRLSADGELIAWVAAVAQGRKTLAEWARTTDQVRQRVDACEAFLAECQMRRPSLPPARYAFTTEISGEYPAYDLQPGDCKVSLSLPGDRGEYLMTAVARSAAGEIVSGLERDLWIYPESVLGETVRAIYIVEDVHHPRRDIAGFHQGHTHSNSDVVVERRGRRRILFHEVGHALHSRFGDNFPDEAWDALTPPGHYFGTATDFIEQGTHVEDYHPSLLARGFITSYSSSAKIEDVAEVIEALFGGDGRLWAATGDSSVIAGKVDLMVEFLRSRVPELSRSFFQQLAGQRHDFERAWGAV